VISFSGSVQSLPSKDRLLIETVIGGRGQGVILEVLGANRSGVDVEALVISKCPSVTLSWVGV
jgi:hypothetical protein